MRIMFKKFKGVRLRDRVRGDGIRRDLGVEKITLKARHAVCAVSDTFCGWLMRIS